MGFKAPKAPPPAAAAAPIVVAPPPPSVDDAGFMQNKNDKMLRRGRGTTVLTSANGLPNLGVTRATSAYSGS